MAKNPLDKIELTNLVTDMSGDYKVIGGLSNIADAIKGLSHETIIYGLKLIDNLIATSEELDTTNTFEPEREHLTRWYEILYDELQSRAALDVLMHNLTGKGYS
jgi:hypothetical protein